jgi:hypothetical protein
VLEHRDHGGKMTYHVRMGIYSITHGTYDELLEKAREGMAPIFRESPGFVSYSFTDTGDGRLVSVTRWHGHEQAEAASAKAAQWVGENIAESVALQTELIGEMTMLAEAERSAA